MLKIFIIDNFLINVKVLDLNELMKLKNENINIFLNK